MSKTNLKNSRNNFQANLQEDKNDFLENKKQILKNSKISKISNSQNQQNKFDSINQHQVSQNEQNILNTSQQKNQLQQNDDNQNESNSNKYVQLNKSFALEESNIQNQLQKSQAQNDNNKYHESKQKQPMIEQAIKKQIKKLEDQLAKYRRLQQFQSSHQKKMQQLRQNLDILKTKFRIRQKINAKKEVITLQRINHLELIFKHYCTHIFKTGKHMTFDRLQYQKIHLTIDRLCVFLKDFGLTAIKMKDGKVRQIIQKQQIIKLFKKISPNCRDLDFQQFIIMIQKLGELYFDSKSNYYQRKQNYRKQRLRIKQQLQKKQKYKQQLLKKYKQKQSNLQKGVENRQQSGQKQDTEGGQNDDLIENLMKQDKQNKQNQQDQQQNIQNSELAEQKNKVKLKSSKTSTKKTLKNPNLPDKTPNQQQNVLTLSKQQKIQYFYQIINVDDIQSFTNKMRQLNLPMFKIYTKDNQLVKNRQTTQTQYQKNTQSKFNNTKINQKASHAENIDQDSKRLKELREKLTQRNQKLKHASTANLSKQEYFQRKMKRSRDNIANQSKQKTRTSKQKKIDITESQINLSSLSKLAYQNINFTKFNPKNFYSKQDDDQIFMKQYSDSPLKTRKPTHLNSKANINSNANKHELSTNRIIDQKQKNSQNLIQKLKQRQNQVEINQKNSQISQMYRFNDRTQRQKRLIDKFLQKNK